MGKPLISNAALQGIYDTMQRMRSARDAGAAHALRHHLDLRQQPESLLAAVLSQLHRRDTLLVPSDAPLVDVAMQAAFPREGTAPGVIPCPGDAGECAAVAAGIAVQKQSTARPGAPAPVTVALLHGLPALTGVTQFMAEHELSLILIAAGGEPESRADAQRRLLRTRVPVMSVDEADAVAVCRVMQESMLRARSAWGGVLIHATAMPGAAEPMLLLEQHLRSRKVIL